MSQTNDSTWTFTHEDLVQEIYYYFASSAGVGEEFLSFIHEWMKVEHDRCSSDLDPKMIKQILSFVEYAQENELC